MNCGDASCDLCYDKNGTAYRDALEELREATAKMKADREKKYMEHIASLDKLHGAVRMFRTWRLYDNGDLKAMTQKHTWQPGVNVTLANGGDASADSGFYGFNSLEELKAQEQKWWEWSQSGEPEIYYDFGYRNSPTPAHWYVCGTILSVGHFKASAKGGRCQKAIPEYIIEPAGADPDFGLLVVKAAEKYGMKIISIEDAEQIQTGVVPWWEGRPIE